MAAVSKTEPLCQPCFYQAQFKVEVNIKKPLQPIHLSTEQLALEVLSLCCQLDLLIRAQVHQFQEQLRHDISPIESEAFHRQGSYCFTSMVISLQQSSASRHVTGCKHVCHYGKQLISYWRERSQLRGWDNLTLQQVISSFKGVLPLSVLKRDIEANFKALKTSLVKEDASKQEPQLPAHYVSW
ncbi:UNVERIFIED_CONTAM: hypothetical protein FKN15_015042 [Acipenser sinensis]